MPAIAFVPADLTRHRALLLDINIEYVSWVHAEMERAFGIPADAVMGMPVADYVASVLDEVCVDAPPQGVFYLVRVDGEVAGMGGLRALGADMAEVKRLYVRPAFRGRRIGQSLLRQLLADASRLGHRRVCLDSAPFMHSAHRLYEAHGFVDAPPHDGAEVPAAFHDRWRFMQCRLPANGQGALAG